MLTKEQIDKLLGVVSLYREDAEKTLAVIGEDVETQEEYEQWTAIELTLEAMKMADWSSDIESLRKENAVLRGILGEIRKGAQNIVEIVEELKR